MHNMHSWMCLRISKDCLCPRICMYICTRIHYVHVYTHTFTASSRPKKLIWPTNQLMQKESTTYTPCPRVVFYEDIILWKTCNCSTVCTFYYVQKEKKKRKEERKEERKRKATTVLQFFPSFYHLSFQNIKQNYFSTISVSFLILRIADRKTNL